MGYLTYLIIPIFLLMLLLNLYFRIKVLKYYRILVKNKVEFEARWILDKRKMEELVLPKYPKYRDEINKFASHIRFSLKLGSFLLLLIILIWAILYFNK